MGSGLGGWNLPPKVSKEPKLKMLSMANGTHSPDITTLSIYRHSVSKGNLKRLKLQKLALCSWFYWYEKQMSFCLLIKKCQNVCWADRHMHKRELSNWGWNSFTQGWNSFTRFPSFMVSWKCQNVCWLDRHVHKRELSDGGWNSFFSFPELHGILEIWSPTIFLVNVFRFFVQ